MADRAIPGRPTHEWTLPRLGLLVGILAGTAVPAYFLLVAQRAPLAWDFRAYRFAARLALRGQGFVGVSPPVGAGEFVYPPITIVAFYPFAALPWEVAYLLQVAGSLGMAVGCGLLMVRYLEAQRVGLRTTDRMLVVGFCSTSTYPLVVYGQGQVDFLVLLGLTVAYLAHRAERELLSGAALGVATVFKLFPLVVGVWYLRHRAWRAVAGLVATCTATLAAGVALFGVDMHRSYLRFLLTERSRVDEFEAGMSPDFSGLTLSRPLSNLLPSVDPALYTPIAVLLLLPVVGLVYTRLYTETDRLVAYLGTIVAMLVVSPATNAHHVVYLYFPLVPLLYCIDDPGVTRTFVAGMVVLSVPFRPRHLTRVLSVLGAPSDTVEAVRHGVRPALSVASVPLVGLAVVLWGCLLHRYRSHRRRSAVEVQSASD
jgi:hypothetical protein